MSEIQDYEKAIKIQSDKTEKKCDAVINFLEKKKMLDIYVELRVIEFSEALLMTKSVFKKIENSVLEKKYKIRQLKQELKRKEQEKNTGGEEKSKEKKATENPEKSAKDTVKEAAINKPEEPPTKPNNDGKGNKINKENINMNGSSNKVNEPKKQKACINEDELNKMIVDLFNLTEFHKKAKENWYRKVSEMIIKGKRKNWGIVEKAHWYKITNELEKCEFVPRFMN